MTPQGATSRTASRAVLRRRAAVWVLGLVLVCLQCTSPRSRRTAAIARTPDAVVHASAVALLPKLTAARSEPPAQYAGSRFGSLVDASVDLGDETDTDAAVDPDAGDAGPHRRGMRTVGVVRWRRMRFVRYHVPLPPLGGAGAGHMGGGRMVRPSRPARPFAWGRRARGAALFGLGWSGIRAPGGGGGPTTVGIGTASSAHGPGAGVAARASLPSAGGGSFAPVQSLTLMTVGGHHGRPRDARELATRPGAGPAGQNDSRNSNSNQNQPQDQRPNESAEAAAPRPAVTTTTTTATSTATRPPTTVSNATHNGGTNPTRNIRASSAARSQSSSRRPLR